MVLASPIPIYNNILIFSLGGGDINCYFHIFSLLIFRGNYDIFGLLTVTTSIDDRQDSHLIKYFQTLNVQPHEWFPYYAVSTVWAFILAPFHIKIRLFLVPYNNVKKRLLEKKKIGYAYQNAKIGFLIIP